MIARLLLVVGLLGALAAGCIGPGGLKTSSGHPTPAPTPVVTPVPPTPVPTFTPSPDPADVAALTAAEARWAANGSTTYRFTISRQCFCSDTYTGPFVVTLSEGAATVTYKGSPANPAALAGLPTDAAGLFAFIRERLGQKDFRATYDPATGFPRSFWSDPVPQAADDELGILITTFDPG